MNRYFMKYVDKTVVPSRYTLSRVREWYQGPVEVINWGVDLEDYYPKKDVIKGNSLIFVGRQCERKGVRYLFLALKILIKSHPSLTLNMVGEKNPKYIDYAKELELEKNIKFIGKVSHNELIEFFSKSKILVLPSVNTSDNKYEGFGLVHLEANACGIPTIGSLNCGNEDAIIDGYNGFLCPQRDVDKIAEKINLLLTDKALYNKIVENSLQHAKNNSWEKNLNKVDVMM